MQLLQVIENCPVTGIRVERNTFGTRQVQGVKTPFGEIKTQCVVNCAGNIQSDPNNFLSGLYTCSKYYNEEII
jgi:glycine/D-amino acid oxidase-like deaminating enzyme